MQCNVNGDDEALSLATKKETEWINHMRQHVEDSYAWWTSHRVSGSQGNMIMAVGKWLDRGCCSSRNNQG